MESKTEKDANVFTRFYHDIKRKEFMALKVLYFLSHGGMITLFSFFTIHAISLGITEKEYGAISGVLPLLAIFAPIVAGGLADKIGNFKIFLSCTLILSGFSVLLFPFIPSASEIHYLPPRLPLNVSCSSHGMNVQVGKPFTCSVANATSTHPLQISICKFICLTSSNDPAIPISSAISEELCEVTTNCFGSSEGNLSIIPDIESSNELSGDVLNSTKLIEVILEVNGREEIEKQLKIEDNICPPTSTFRELNKNQYSEIEETSFSVNKCRLECEASVSTEDVCLNEFSVEEKNRPLTLFVYIVVRTINIITIVCSLPLFEGAVVAILQEHKGDFGFQKMFGNLGLIVMPPISGALIDAFSTVQETNYRPAFYIFFVTKMLCAFFILFVDLNFKKPAKKLLKEMKHLLIRIEVICYILIGFIAGIMLGVIDTYLFLLLDRLGANKSMMGLTITVGASFGIPMQFISSWIINKIGQVNTMCLSFSVFVIRLLGYSLITNPWAAMPFEAMECLTTALFGVAATSYAAKVSTPATIATLQGLFGGLMYGIGRGVGAMLGGIMIDAIELAPSFQIFSGISAVVAASYFTINMLVLKKKENKREEEKKMKEENDKEKVEISVIETNHTKEHYNDP